MFLLHHRLKHIKRKLKEWNKNGFGNILKAKVEMEKKLQEINKILITEGFTKERKIQVDSLQQEWGNRCQQEEIFWRQKSKVQWIKEGKRNRIFFHKSTMPHRANNGITKPIYPQGIEKDTHKEMETILVQRFQSIEKETMAGISQFTKRFTQHIPKLVTKEDNQNINR